MAKKAGDRRKAYRPELARRAGILEQSFHANFVVTQKEGAAWLIAFGDLLGDDALGNQRPPIHSLLVHVSGPPSRRKVSIELNDQGNTREQGAIERFELTRDALRIRVKPGTELWSGRVSYVPEIDPFAPDGDPEPRPIRGVHVTFPYEKATHASIGKLLATVRADWLTVAP